VLTFATKSMNLNSEQVTALARMLAFLESGDKFFLLSGFAGTGKSFTVTNSLHQIRIRYPYKRICLSAPTNKAVAVLRDNCKKFGMRSIDCMTIYKLLALQPIEGENEAVLLEDKYSRPTFGNYDIVYIDEASMISLKLWVKIMNETTKHANKVILVGDEAQLTPVGEDISPALKVPSRFQLTNIVRQAKDSPLMTVVQQARELVYNPNDEWTRERSLVLPDKSQGVWVLDKPTWVKAALNSFRSTNYQEDGNHTKIITWKNDTADYLNLQIREQLRNGTESFVPGEKLTAREAVFHPYDKKVIILPTASECQVISAMPHTWEMEGVNGTLEAWKLKVKGEDGLFHRVTVIDPNEMIAFKKLLKGIAEQAGIVKASGDFYGSKSLWRLYWDAKKSVADLVYLNTLTSRRSQGSSYTNVFAHIPDILSNQQPSDRWRNLYTTVSRAKLRLFLLI
jgi:ATP-dependent exoDNAse (exonuclease V) alpha subunit